MNNRLKLNTNALPDIRQKTLKRPTKIIGFATLSRHTKYLKRMSASCQMNHSQTNRPQYLRGRTGVFPQKDRSTCAEGPEYLRGRTGVLTPKDRTLKA